MYESFFGLSGNPFKLSPDPDFYYDSPIHKRAYAYLEYGLYQGEGFIVITGEVGAGKTTIVRNLLAHLDASKVVAAHLVSTMLDADDLVRAVCAAFGLPTRGTDKGSLLAELEQFLKSIALERKRALLIVDEAQNLTARAIEELRMLSNFQISDRGLLQSFLVGQPELRKVMQHPSMQQLRQRVIASYHLGALDRQESIRYIEHRMLHVGWKRQDPTFEPGTMDAIYAFTAGIPRRINLVCNRLLLSAFLRDAHVLTPDDVGTVADELKEELGPTTSGSSDKPDRSNHGRDATDPLVGNGDEAALAAPEEGEHLTERVVRLEKTLTVVLNTLRRLVRVIEPAARQES
ncbi:MAG: XrtA-associated ATPase [Burkholderiales bacterium]|nr:XrtA-associated ATPase [Burkholderiales bacterium]